MIKKLLLLFVISLTTANLFAQNRGNGGRGNTPAAPPVLFREVSGVVRDTSDNTLIGATITLTSRKDTLRTTTNADGVFVLKNVKLATFTLTISEVGFITSVRKYLQNDAVKRLVLEPIILKSSTIMMNEVKINGTPSIVYKVDTVEYKASDYKVRDNATIDELLKKMEGFEVGSDGTVTHQGQQITKAKLNGKIYASGDVATAIQNLPADIVEKIQVVDDYGDQAARTGIKDGDPQKVLNITTKADRSVGTTGTLTTQYGSDDRYNANLFVQRINANQQLGVIANIRNTVNGVASSGVAGGATNGGGGGTGVGAGAAGSSSPGTTKSGGPQLNYRDQWSKKVQVTAGYGYNFSDNNSINQSYGTNYSDKGNSNFTDKSTAQRNSRNHSFNFELDYTIDSANYLQVTPTFTYANSSNSSNSFTDNFNKYVTGFEHPVVQSLSSSINTAPNYSGIVFYQHIFKKPRRNLSVQFSVNKANTDADGERNADTKNYADSTTNVVVKDSTAHLFTFRNSINTTYRASFTYVEPFSIYSQFEFNGQTRRSEYNNIATTDTVINNQLVDVTRYDNIYDYSFTETRLTFNYRFNGIKWNWSLGTTLVPSSLQGKKLDNSSQNTYGSIRNDFRAIPVFRFAYSWSRTERFTLAYAGTNTEPSFQQIQPFTDRTNPDNLIVGNPDLKPSFAHSITAQYNNYIANSKLNFSFGVNYTLTDNQIGSNRLFFSEPIGVKKGTNGARDTVLYKTIYETHYVNFNGSHAIVGRYNIAKQLDDRRYNLSLNGNITYSYNVGFSNNVEYHNTNWRFDERFGPRLNPTESIEINPYIGYDLSRSFTSLATAMSTSVQTTSLAVDGRFYFFKTWQVNYNASKSYVTGLGNLSTNPLVINAGFEKEFFKKKSLVLTLNTYDLLHQNNFIQQTLTTGGVTNTLSNSLSRYFLVGIRLRLQKWSGAPTRNGKKMNRRGDGSFIYE
ncbi:carboxypeptidase-like protein [Mucilaginibacter gracilis]|uniref:Carboxypeptidase-like protein n=1 Tax=Mucilaginibacter gracilis TaxID=423350 RepID=A0A495J3G8_9SPHI|nr:outer membrane beta-barrel protein [Mucilaginibacter gracilis]RKR83487.1 carboxypeptidase-like protein [Mucilaginibacter gracilis]